MQEKDILHNLRLVAFSEMQQNAFGIINKNKNVILLAPTGTGKTLAYLVPLASIVEAKGIVKVIIMSPTRELALQIDGVFKKMKTPLVSMAVYGGRAAMEEHRLMKLVNPDIIIGTPGRLIDHISKGNINVKGITSVIIDEFDKMLELNFQDEVEQLMSLLSERERCVLVSATDMTEMPDFMSFNNQYPIRLNYLEDSLGKVPEKIKHFMVSSPEKDKLITLKNILLTIEKGLTVVFVNYREAVVRVSDFLKKEGFSVMQFHGGMEQDRREMSLSMFKNGSCNILVSTDLSARGLDVKDLRHVIHYHIPMNFENYLHRCGRTGRWEESGESFVIIGPQEVYPEYENVFFEEYRVDGPYHKPFKPEWVTIYIGKGKKDKLSKGDVVGFLCKIGGLASNDIGNIDVRNYYTYVAVCRNKSKQVLQRVAGEKIKNKKTKVEEVEYF